MELLPYSDADLGLTEAIECDPEMMRELGGGKFGFSKLEECDGGYAGRAFRCNHWELEL